MAKRVKELSDQLNHLQVQHEQLMQRNKLLEMALGSGQEQRNRSSSLDIKKEVCPPCPLVFYSPAAQVVVVVVVLSAWACTCVFRRASHAHLSPVLTREFPLLQEPAPVRQSLSNQSGASAKLEKHPSTDSHLSTTEALQPDEYFEPGDAEQVAQHICALQSTCSS